MRFNNRACALMDIPDLPQSAFEHIGDRKIKPQGGGGNPISVITDPISSAIGTDGGGGGILGGLADIDPGPAIGSGLAEVDDFVNDEIPGGWITVGLAAATAGAASGAGAGAGAATGTAAGGTAAGTGLTAGAGASGGLLASGGTVGALGGAGTAAGVAGTQAAAGLGLAGGSALAGTGAAIGAGLGGVGGLSPALPAAGGVGGAGLSAQLAPGTILGTGLPGGGAIGSSYMLGAGGLPALNAAGQLIPASSISFGGQAVPAGSLGIKDALDIARLGRGMLAQSPATPAGATAQFRGNTMPQGAVDYSGILNLLQAKSPQRNPNSLLG